MNINLLAGCVLLLLAGFAGNRPPLVAYEQPLPRVLDSLQLRPEQTWVHISKSACTLSVRYNALIVKSYPVVFGTNPVDDKRYQGDGCTPEGEFLLTDKYPHKRYGYFIFVNYPTADSYRKHREAQKAGKVPGGMGVGGDIGIHGVPPGYDYEIDNLNHWTVGCIAMKRGDVQDLYQGIWKGMYCKIEP